MSNIDEVKRNLELDLKVLTTIPPDPSEVNMISDVVAPHALRRAIAAEAEIENARSLRDFAVKKSNERLKEEIASHGPEGRNYTNREHVELLLAKAEQDKELIYWKEQARTNERLERKAYELIDQKDKELRTTIDFLKEIRRTTEYTLENDGDNLFALKSSLTVAWQRSWNALPEEERVNL